MPGGLAIHEGLQCCPVEVAALAAAPSRQRGVPMSINSMRYERWAHPVAGRAHYHY